MRNYLFIFLALSISLKTSAQFLEKKEDLKEYQGFFNFHCNEAEDEIYPNKINNVVALSGYVNQGILKEGFENNDFSKLDFYCSHGSVDQVIPVEWARKTKPFLDKLNIKNAYSEFPVGHGVAPQNFFELKDWLKKRI